MTELTPRAPSLWRQPAFLGMWSAQTISELGSQFTTLALPVVAVLLLHAEEWQLGVLNAASTAAFLLVGLPAGAWVDRWIKRRVMITADLVRAVAVASIPVLWAFGVLQLWQVAVVALVMGVANVFFDVSYQSYVPILVPREQITDANARLEASAQVARVGGPAAAGGLLSIIAAPLLLVFDGVSYLFSAAFLFRVKDSEQAADKEQRQSLWKEIAEGVRFVAHQPYIRRVVGTTASFNLFGTMTFTLAPLLILKELHLGAAGLGLIFSVGAVGGLLGAVAAPRVARWLGDGTAISISAVIGAVLLFWIPLSVSVGAFALPLLLVAEFASNFMTLVYNITQVTLRQRLCPPRLLGRMNASIRFVVWGVMPISSLLAGGIGAWLGVIPTMYIAAIGTVLGCGFVVFSRISITKSLPELAVEPALADPTPTDPLG